jgi:putative exporter of polyketide antibiotics
MSDVVTIMKRTLKLFLVFGVAAVLIGIFIALHFSRDIGFAVVGLGIGVLIISADVLRGAPKSVSE